MPLTDPVPSSAFDVLERNIQDTDKFVNQETGTFTNRVGKEIKPIPVIEAEANAAVISLGWHQVGLFADGFTYALQNDIAKDAAGDWYRWNGALPKVVIAGTLPSSDVNFVKIDYKSHADLSDRNPADGSAHNADDVKDTTNGGSVQDFIDSFALKIFQSPTDGGLTEIQTRTANANEVYEVRKTSDNSLATIYSDAAGTIEIIQNGTANKSGSDGVVEFYIDDGAYYILYEGSNFYFDAYSSKSKFNLVKSQPVCPPSTDSTKLIMRPSGEAGFWVVSKRSRNRGGFIMTLVRDDVAAADANNTGGSGITRPSIVNNCPFVYVAHSVASATSGNVTQPTLDQNFIDSVWRYNNSGTDYSYFSEAVDTSASNLSNRKLYNVNSGTGNDYVEFTTRGDSTLHLGTSTGSSDQVEVQVLSNDGTLAYSLGQFNLKQVGTNRAIGRVIHIVSPSSSRYGFYRVRVINRSTLVNEACYVAGLNIAMLDEVDPTTYVTNALALRSTAAPRYRASSGANEFAARESGGKFFGTFHGGHDQIFERLRTDNSANHDIQADAVPSLLLTRHCTLYSKSRLKPASGVMSFEYLLTVRFADGLDMATQSINVTGGAAPICSDVYTHMCTTDTTFDYIYQPKYFESLPKTNTKLGDVQTIEQYRASGGLTMAAFFSGVDVSKNNFGGAYIQDSSNFHKQYYGPIVGKIGVFSGGTFTTIKEYF